MLETSTSVFFNNIPPVWVSTYSGFISIALPFADIKNFASISFEVFIDVIFHLKVDTEMYLVGLLG